MIVQPQVAEGFARELSDLWDWSALEAAAFAFAGLLLLVLPPLGLVGIALAMWTRIRIVTARIEKTTCPACG